MQIRLYATLRDLVNAKAIEVEVDRPTDVRSVLRDAGAAHPALGAKLWTEQGNLSKSIQVLVNGRPVNFLQGLETPVRVEDRIDLFPPVGGG